VTACAQFGANLALKDEQIASVDDVFWPLYAHAAYVFDYFTWDKELRVSKEMGSQVPIINAIPLLERLHGLSVPDAKSWLRDKCLEFEKEYLRRKDDFLQTHADASISLDLRRWFSCQEAIATGFNIWNMTTYRHRPSSESQAGYGEYYARRCSEGALWFDTVSESEYLLTGGSEVRYETGKMDGAK
jgi:hypothetical protein